MKKVVSIFVIVIICFVVCFETGELSSDVRTAVPVSNIGETPKEKSSINDEIKLSDTSKYKLNLVSEYTDIEAVYPNYAYHPKLLDLGSKKWCGYRYWISYTPYPAAMDMYENPHIVASNDLVNFSEIKFAEPIPENHKKSVAYNSDSHLVYNDDLDRLEIYWRYVDSDIEYASIWMRYSTDGENWSEKQPFFETYEKSKYDMVSPAIIYENGIYKVWYVNKYKVCYREFKNGNWSDISVTDLDYEDSALTWHLDIIKTEKGYELLSCAAVDKKDRKHMNLYYSCSDDGINWDIAKVVVKPSSDTENWDGGGMYRSSFIYSDGLYYVYYGARNDYSNMGTGLLVGKDIFDLKGIDIDYINEGEHAAEQLAQIAMDLKKVYWYLE